MILSLAEIKDHLRLDGADDAQLDLQLERLELAAIDYASQYIGRSIPWTCEDGKVQPVPESVKQALLLLISDFFEHRENTVVGASVNDTEYIDRLLHFYRVGLGV